jgi:hypothetical protein
VYKEPTVLEYLAELRLWGYKEESFSKLYLVAAHVTDLEKINELFEEWKKDDPNYEWMCYGSYTRIFN